MNVICSFAATSATRIIPRLLRPAGQEALKDKFKTELKKRKLGPLYRVNSAGCLDQCESGPVVVLYPQAIWYGGVTSDDVERILGRDSDRRTGDRGAADSGRAVE